MIRACSALVACALLLAAGSITAAAAPSTAGMPRTQAATARHDGRIAFDACGDTGCDIYTANPDGTAVRQVTDNGVSFMPDWSADGRSIAYASDASGATAIWIVRANGTHSRQLTPNEADAANVWPRFAADGRTVFYTNCFTDECDGGISSIRTDGSHQRVVTPDSGDSYNIGTPSPDGTRMAFMRWHAGRVLMRVYLKRLSGSRPRPEIPLTPPALEGWAPDWSPSGADVIFSSNVFANRPNGAIYRVAVTDGDRPGALRKLTHPRFPLDDWSPAYAPRGDRIVFVSDRRHPLRDDSDLFIMRSGGGGLHRMALPPRLDGLYVEWPSWSTAPLEAAAGSGRRFSSSRSVAGRAALCTSMRRYSVLAAALPSRRLGCRPAR